MITVPVLDALYPYAGPCMFCGGPDKRHRLADAITENIAAGDSIASVADAYDVAQSAARELVAGWRPGKCNLPTPQGPCAYRGSHLGPRHRALK